MTLKEATAAGLLFSPSVARWISCGQIPGLKPGLNGKARQFTPQEIAVIRVYELGSGLGSLEIAGALAWQASQNLRAGIIGWIEFQSDELTLSVDLAAVVARISEVSRG